MTAGIAADNYKLDKFKSELIKAGYYKFEINSFTKDTSIIKVEIGNNDISIFKNICESVELYFKRSN